MELGKAEQVAEGRRSGGAEEKRSREESGKTNSTPLISSALGSFAVPSSSLILIRLFRLYLSGDIALGDLEERVFAQLFHV